ncbi:MAG: hypothetical protein ABIF01_01045 [Candidatus Micrarchaeota archaeon]
MGLSKKDLSRRRANIQARIAELEPKARMDPLKKHPGIHEELAKLKAQLAEK